ncbi:MAG: M50 family metallopeptidase [Actinobacteria bacterium]|nr:M50 family metallopeptidase [Actinomycetota bacterium]MCG2803413.1 M50 family metallopeptidase [Cellulomonas sp.]
MSYEDSDVELLRKGSTVTAKLKSSRRFVEIPLEELPQVPWSPRLESLSRRKFAAYMIALCAAILFASGTALCEAQNLHVDLMRWRLWLWLVAYSFSQLFLHELAHILTLRHFGRRPDRMGFTVNYWIFPAFYVRMNDTHLLTRSEKIVVHSSGLFVNAIMGAIAFLVVDLLELGDAGRFVVAWYAVAMMMNAVPLLNSDGYKVVLAVCGVSERREAGRNPPMIRIATGASVVVAACYAAALLARLVGALQ